MTDPMLSLSVSAREAFRFGESAREAWGNTLFFTEHLLIGLLQKADGPARALLAAAGVDDVDSLLARNVRESDHLGRAEYSPSLSLVIISPDVRDLPLSPNTKTTLDIAERFAGERVRGNDPPQVRSRHLLYALLQNKDAVAHQWLKECLQDSPISAASASASLKDLDESLSITVDTFSPYRPQPAIHDGVASEDLLGFDRPARALAQMLLQPTTQPPVVVGIYGEWGSGKSTFMNEVRKWVESRVSAEEPAASLAERIDGALSRFLSRGALSADNEPDSPQILCVEYNAWEYADSDRLWTGLIQDIVAQLDKRLTWKERLALGRKQVATHYLNPVVMIIVLTIFFASVVLVTELTNSALAAVGTAGAALAAGILFLAEQIEQPLSNEIRRIIEDMQKQREESATHRVQEALRTTVEANFAAPKAQPGAPAGQPRLKVFVFIDDLDRCQLESIVEILEAIKLFLAEQIFFVLMAVDTRVLAEAIRTRYKREDSGHLAREYIEKIVQVPVQVPVAAGSRLEFLLKNLMRLEETAEDGGEGAPVHRADAPAGDEDTTDRAREDDEDAAVLMESLPDTPTEMETIASLAERYLDSNPRRIKRLLNTYRYVKILSHWYEEDTEAADWQRLMITWLVFTMRWPHFMQEAILQAEATEDAAENESPFLPLVPSAPARRPSAVDLQLLPLTQAQVLRFAELANNFLAEIAPTAPLPEHDDSTTPVEDQASENGNRTAAESDD